MNTAIQAEKIFYKTRAKKNHMLKIFFKKE